MSKVKTASVFGSYSIAECSLIVTGQLLGDRLVLLPCSIDADQQVHLIDSGFNLSQTDGLELGLQILTEVLGQDADPDILDAMLAKIKRIILGGTEESTGRLRDKALSIVEPQISDVSTQ